jgi:DNA repair exonuclease SbcCD nuclease subunit
VQKYLVVGDVHATVNELSDCESLMELVSDSLNPDTTVVFLGDQYHTHANIRVEVIDFWNRTFRKLTKTNKVVAIVGNHDMPGDSSKALHAMMANQMPNLQIVDSASMVDDWLLLLPYYHDAAKFVEDVNKHNPLTVICHQTFNGAQYENGFYAKDGVDPETLKCNQVISGHIHTPAVFSKVEYVGAPRWRTASDANIDRFIHLYEKTSRGLKLVKKIPTGMHCRRILSATVYEDGTVEGRTDALDKDSLHIDVHGSKEFCAQKRAEWETEGIRIRTFPKTEKTVKVKESEGIEIAFAKYVQEYCGRHQLAADEYSKLVMERLGGVL